MIPLTAIVQSRQPCRDRKWLLGAAWREPTADGQRALSEFRRQFEATLAQHSGCTKIDGIVHYKQVNFVVCEFNLN